MIAGAVISLKKSMKEAIPMAKRKLTNKFISKLFKSLAMTTMVLTSQKTSVIRIDGEDLAYTVAPTGKHIEIFLNPTHQYFDNLSDVENIAVIKGLWAHETLHQLFTDFSVLKKIERKSNNKYAVEILHFINNIIEDIYIERYAHTQLGNLYVKCIHFKQAIIYKHTDILNDCESELQQFIAALVQYKTFGPLKGEFSSNLARECFAKSLPIIDQAVDAHDPLDRYEASVQVWEISRPLWEKEAEDQQQMEKMLKDLIDKLKSMGMISNIKNASNKNHKGNVVRLSSSEQPDSSKDDARHETRMKLKIEESEESSEKNDSNLQKNDADHNHICNNTEPYTETSGWIDEEYHLSDEDAAEIEKEMENIIKSIQTEERERQSYKKEEIDVKFDNPINIRVRNKRIISNDAAETAYKQIVNDNKSLIKKTAIKFKEIFLNDTEETEHGKTGKLNILRTYGVHKTERIFDKTIEPKNINDTSIMLLVDESGSMSGYKELIAKQAAIIIAEICKEVSLPFGCIGFTADSGYGSELDHNVYCNFRNKATEYYALADIRARANNMDGYSIRYAASMLQKQHSTYQLLIVISDGMPSCSAYRYNEGIADTRKAIQETRRKKIPVVGIAIGLVQEDDYIQMYGNDFVHCQNVSDLGTTLCRVVRKQVEKNFR